MIGDAQHGEIVEGVEVVLGEAALAHRLAEWDEAGRVAQIADEAAEVGIGISMK